MEKEAKKRARIYLYTGEGEGKTTNALGLDEINLATTIGLLRIEDVLNFLDIVPEETTVVMTGRRAPKEFIERADLVTMMQMVKHPYQKGIPAKEGIEF